MREKIVHVLTFFFDNQGVVYSETMPKKTIINSIAYYEILNKLRDDRGSTTRGNCHKALFLTKHSNATLHSANVTKELLRKFK